MTGRRRERTRVRQEIDIVLSDKIGDLVQEVRTKSWGKTADSVLEILKETHGPEALENMSPEELIHWGYCQGAGHVIIALVAGELRVKYTGTVAQLKKDLKDGLGSV